MSENDETGGGTMHDQQSIDDLAAAYALDALSPEDRALFEAQASPEARRDAEELADVSTLLAVDEVTPPPSLRASVLDAIRAEGREGVGSSAATEPSDAGVGAAASIAPAASGADEAPRAASFDPASRRPGPAERRAQARWRPMQLIAGIAAGAAILTGGIAIGSQLLGGSEQEALGAVVAAADAERVQIDLEGGATATAIWSAELGQSVLLFDELGPAPHGHAYQAWYIDEDGPHSAGVFQGSGASTAVLLEGELDAGVAMGVTVEPEGGSEAPTTDPFLVVQT